MRAVSSMRTALRHLIAATLAVSITAGSGKARGEAPVAIPESTAPSDTGWRIYVVMGTPSILGLGLGYKLGRAELLVNAGGFAYYHVAIAVVETSLHFDVVRWPGGSAYVGGSYALRYEPATPRDCSYQEPDCEDDVTAADTTVVAGPRVGARTMLLASPGLGRSLHLDVSAGPKVHACGERCSGAAELGFAGLLRLVLRF